jgi:hypothetical protein
MVGSRSPGASRPWRTATSTLAAIWIAVDPVMLSVLTGIDSRTYLAAGRRLVRG